MWFIANSRDYYVSLSVTLSIDKWMRVHDKRSAKEYMRLILYSFIKLYETYIRVCYEWMWKW